MRRRTFLAGCGAAGIASVGEPWRVGRLGEACAQAGPRVQLVGEEKTPLRAPQLVPHKTYVFLYPFESTPCFLLDLGRGVPGANLAATGGAAGYAWGGGVGPLRSIVAYSAICPHAYTHPTPEVTMIHYFGPDTPATVSYQRVGVVTCCAHGSTFDPARGAIPLQPPAEVPLASVMLEWEPATDALYAVGVVGQPVFDQFFRSFPKNRRREMQGATAVWELERYSRSILPC